MSVQEINSSAIQSVQYTRYLDIKFKSGKTYRYVDVPDVIYEEFMQSDSKGKFFRENIRDRYANLLVEAEA